MSCPEANIDILFLLSSSKKKYDDLHFTEIQLLNYLSFLLSVYDGHKSDEWGYVFSYNSFGGPISSDIANELELLKIRNFVVEKNGFYSLNTTSEKVIHYISTLLELKRFDWRVKYISTSMDACLSRTLPKLFEALKNEPGIKIAESLGRRTVLHVSEEDSIYAYFRALKVALGDMRSDLLVPASLWIDYLTLISKQVATHD